MDATTAPASKDIGTTEMLLGRTTEVKHERGLFDHLIVHGAGADIAEMLRHEPPRCATPSTR